MKTRVRLGIGILFLLLVFQNCGGGMRSHLSGLSRAADNLPGSQSLSTTSVSHLAAGGKKARAARILLPVMAALSGDAGASPGAAGGCKAPRYYYFELSSNVPLGCDYSWSGRTNIFTPTIPDEGMAVTRATLLINKSSSNGPGGWSVGAYVGVGGGVSSDMADNINPGESVWKTVLGSGELNKAYGTGIRLSGYNYSGNTCVAGDFTVMAGSRMEVWVEDPKPECRGKYVGLKSLYSSQTTPLTWGQDSMSMSIPATSDGSQILLLSSIEGTIYPCASGSLTTSVSTNLTSGVGSATGSIPTSGQQGQCHLSLATSNWISYSPALTSMTLHLSSGVSKPAYSGYIDYAQGKGAGEGVIGFVKQ